MATSGFKIKVGLDSTAAERGLSNIGRGARRLNKSLGRMAGAGAKLGAGLVAAAGAMAAFGAIRFIKDSSRKAAEFEQMTGAFETLLGTGSKATERIKRLQEFSVKTPYTPTELVKASKLLEGLGGETLAIGEGLEMIGDAASGADQPLELIAENVGRLFSSMTQGEGFMEPLNQLRLYTSVSKEGFQSLKNLNDEMIAGDQGALSSAEAFKRLKGAMTVWTGEMDKASKRHGGMVSTMKGNMDLLQIDFGDGINKGLSKGVELMNEKIPQWRSGAEKLGDAIGQGIGQAFTGNTELLELQVAYAFTRMAEIGAAVFLKVLTTLVSEGLAGWLSTAFEMDPEKVAKMEAGEHVWDDPVRPILEMGSKGWSHLLRSEGRASDFPITDFTDFVGKRDSAAILERIEEILIRTREDEPKGRPVHDSILGHGALEYIIPGR